jgi:MFS family permease
MPLFSFLVLSSGGSVAYIIASCLTLRAGINPSSWKWTFWVSAGVTLAAAIVRLIVPESRQFVHRKDDDSSTEAEGVVVVSGWRKVVTFLQDFKVAMKHSWKRFLCILVLAASILFIAQASVRAVWRTGPPSACLCRSLLILILSLPRLLLSFLDSLAAMQHYRFKSKG